MRIAATLLVGVALCCAIVVTVTLSPNRSSPFGAARLVTTQLDGVVAKRPCFNVTAWYTAFSPQPPWKKYSQGNQDQVLTSLFDDSELGSTNKFYVEFGFNQKGYLGTGQPSGPNSKFIGPRINIASGANTALMHFDWGWKGLLMDGGFEFEPDNLHKEWIKPENIASLFQKYNVPKNVDYVSIDIDSCDLWVYVGLIKGPGNFRPRVLTVEYNSNYALEDSKTNRCIDKDGKPYFFNDDYLYGASLGALYKAAQSLNYTMVYATKWLDVFLVDKDLVCPGTELSLETFRGDTALPNHVFGDGISRQVLPEEVSRWIVNYTGQDYHPEVVA